MPPTFGVSQKWLPRSLYKGQNTPFRSIASRNPAVTVTVDSSSTRRYGLRLCERGGKPGALQHAFHPAIAEPDLVLAGQLLVKMPQIKIEILLPIEGMSGEVYEPLGQGMSPTIAPAVAA